MSPLLVLAHAAAAMDAPPPYTTAALIAAGVAGAATVGRWLMRRNEEQAKEFTAAIKHERSECGKDREVFRETQQQLVETFEKRCEQDRESRHAIAERHEKAIDGVRQDLQKLTERVSDDEIRARRAEG